MTDKWGQKVKHNTLIKVRDLKYIVLENKTLVSGGVTYLFEGLHVFRGQEYHGNLDEFTKKNREWEVFL